VRIKKSLSFRVFLSIFLALALVLGLSKVAFNYYASSFYYNTQMDKMIEASQEIKDILESDINRLNTEALQIASSLGGIITIRDTSGRLVYSSQLINQMGSDMHRSNNPRAMGHMRRVEENVYFTNTLTGDYELLNYGLEANGYTITTSLATKFIDDSISAVSTLYNYLLFASLLVALIVSYFVAKQISKPLISLNDTAKELALLNLNVRHLSNREDEIGQLSKTFNEMAKRLQTTITRLEQELSREKYSEQLRKNFVARASHELKTPLAIVKGYTEALADGVITSKSEVAEYSEIISSEIDKASNMVAELLELSKLENPEYKVEKQNLELVTFLDKLVRKYSDKKISGNTDIIFSHELTHVSVLADPIRLEQAFGNILRNAIRFASPSGEVVVSIDDSLLDVTIKIFNQGPKIEEKNLANIWDSFFTTEKDIHANSGSGLGLAIAKQIFLRHNALFGAYNEEDGVVFWATLKKASDQ